MNINIQAPVNDMGYGVTGLQLIIALNRLGYNISLWPIGNMNAAQNYHTTLQDMVNNQGTFDATAPSLKIWHQFDMAAGIGRGARIGFPIFELDTFTQRELNHLNSLDKIFVCSHWAMNIVAKHLPDRLRDIYVVPLGVDRDVFNSSIGNDPHPGWTTFINIGKWEIRKGHDILAEAFSKAFSPKQRVRLWMMNSSPFLNETQTNNWQELYNKTVMGRAGKVHFIPRASSQTGVAKLMSECHCGVFPARAEGWNLELLEMMSMGKHVITTNYSGHTEYANETNARLVNITILESAVDNIWFHGEGNWARLGGDQIDELVEHMRSVYTMVQSGMSWNLAGIETANRFTWQKSAERLAACIKMEKTDY